MPEVTITLTESELRTLFRYFDHGVKADTRVKTPVELCRIDTIKTILDSRLNQLDEPMSWTHNTFEPRERFCSD